MTIVRPRGRTARRDGSGGGGLGRGRLGGRRLDRERLLGGRLAHRAQVDATAGLLLVVLRAPAGRAPALVAAYIGAAYWFTSSTSFANPAAVLGRMFSDSFAGIAPASAPGFVIAEVIGAALALGLHGALEPRSRRPGHPNTIESSGRPELR